MRYVEGNMKSVKKKNEHETMKGWFLITEKSWEDLNEREEDVKKRWFLIIEKSREAPEAAAIVSFTSEGFVEEHKETQNLAFL